jgi:cell division protein FtsZ
MTLMERLAAAGLGRRPDAREEAPAAQQARPAQPAQRSAPAHHLAPPLPSPVHQEYAKRTAPAAQRPQGSLDQLGRTTAPARSLEDDQLEIPAFLRRQSN